MVGFSQIMRALTILSLVTWGLSLFFTAGDDSDIKKFSSIEELKEFLGGAQSGYGTARALAESASDKSAQYSTTNVQVEGVDEGDIVKTDGRRIFTVSGQNVVITEAYPPESAKISAVIEVNQSIGGIYISNDKLVVFGSVSYAYPEFGGAEEKRLFMPAFYRPRSFIYIYDTSSLELRANVTLDGYLANSRLVDGYVYAIANSPINSDNLELPSIIANGIKDDVLPEEIYHFRDPDSSYQFTEIISINVDQNSLKSKTILTGSTSTIFSSRENIYLASQQYFDYMRLQRRAFEEILIPTLPPSVRAQLRSLTGEQWEIEQKAGEIVQEYLGTIDGKEEWEEAYWEKYNALYAEMMKESQRTIINKFSINNGKIDFRAQGSVPGYVLNQFSMDEFNGNFRIATTTNTFGFGIAVSEIAQSAPSGRAISETLDFQSEAEISIFVEDDGLKIETASKEAESDEPLTIETPQPIASEPESSNHLFVLNRNLEIIGRLRLELIKFFNIQKQKDFAFCWVIDFPLFDYNEDQKRYEALHHPFTSPQPDGLSFMEEKPLEAKARAYDLVLNGVDRTLEVVGQGTIDHTGPIGGDAATAHATVAWGDGLWYDDLAGIARCVGNATALITRGSHVTDRLGAELIVVELADAPGGASNSKAEPGADRSLSSLEATGAPATIEVRRYRPGVMPPMLERLMYLEGTKIHADNAAGRLDVPSAGKLLVMDRREARENAPATHLPNPERDMGRGTALFTWRESLTMEKTTGEVTMKDGVRLVHDRGDGSPKTTLDSAWLTAKVRQQNGRVGAVASERTFDADLLSASAGDGVRLVSGEKEITAATLEYDAVAATVDAKGGNGLVSLMDKTGKTPPAKASRILWYLKTDRIEATGVKPIVTPK